MAKARCRTCGGGGRLAYGEDGVCMDCEGSGLDMTAYNKALADRVAKAQAVRDAKVKAGA